MKRLVPYIFLWAIAVMMAACSDAEEPLRSRPLTFAVSEEPQARGTAFGTTWGTTEGSAFNVVAHYYAPATNTPLQMMDNTVTYSFSNGVWRYSPVVYWPTEGTMDFFSYAPACTGAKAEISRFTPVHTDYQAIIMDCHVPASEITTIHSLGTANNAITALPHDAAHQYDLMFAYLRDVPCAEQGVTDKVNLQFAHAMAGVKVDFSGLDKTKLPTSAAKMIVGIGRVKTGGTLAICEPATPGGLAVPEWTLDGLEGTFYETYNVTWTSGSPTLSRDNYGRPVGMSDAEWQAGDVFFFPPQTLDTELTVAVFFYNALNQRIGYHLLYTDIKTLTLGKIMNIKVK